MPHPSTARAANTVSEHFVSAPSEVIRQTRVAVNAALDALSEGAQSLREDASDAGQAADAKLQEGLASIRHASQALLDQAQSGTASLQQVIRRDPIKSVLIAAASGAALTALVGMLSRSHRHD